VTGKSLACEYQNGPCPVCQIVTEYSRSHPEQLFPFVFVEILDTTLEIRMADMMIAYHI